MEYYVYYHVRLDTNKIFYVGVGTKSPYGNIYYRAYVKGQRNAHWKNIIKTVSYEVYIVKEFETKKEALIYETRLIQMFGLKKEGFELVNIIKDSTLVMQSSDFGNFIPTKKVYKYTSEGVYLEEYPSVKLASKIHNLSRCSISNSIKYGNGAKAGDFVWSFEKHEKLQFYRPKKINKLSKPVFQYSLEGDFIKEWVNAEEAGKSINRSLSAIKGAIKGRQLHCGGFQWKDYKADKIENLEVKNLKINTEPIKIKEIFQYDLEGNFVRRWDSIRTCCETNNYDKNRIQHACSGRNSTAYDFRWT